MKSIALLLERSKDACDAHTHLKRRIFQKI